MNSDPDWIRARGFVPAKIPGLIWRALNAVSPEHARSYMDRLVRASMHRMRRMPRAYNGQVTLVGGFQLTIGVARTAQILRDAMEAAQIPLYAMDCSAVLRPMPGPPVRHPAPAHGTMIFCINPPQMTPLLRHFGPRICRGKRLIGYWWWELDRLPRSWRPWAELMDEIWVASRFVQETLARDLPGKVIRHVPLPVPEPMPSRMSRPDFGLAAEPFTVLTAFDLSSGWQRKNPLGAIEAFKRAFPDPGMAQLVLKVSGADQNAEQMERLRALIDGAPNIHILDRTLPPEDLAALIRCADVLLSLHRSEGLGLFIAEAMWLGTPVVATAWSGSMDMLDGENAMLVRFDLVPVRPEEYPLVESGARWAEPDTGHAAECLSQLAADASLRNRLREKARQRAEQQFNLARFRELAPPLLRPLGTNRQST